MKKIILTSVFILTGIIVQAQGTLLYQVEANWEAVSDVDASLRIEDFAGGPASNTICGQVISSSGNNCFAAGELEPFFEIRTANNEQVAYGVPGFLGTLQTEPVILTSGINDGDYLVINFDTSLENVSRVSFDVFAETVFNSNMANIRVFDTTGSLITTLNGTLQLDDFTFVGIQSTTAIGRVEVEDANDDTALAITDLRYGVTRANDDGINPFDLTVGEDFEDFDVVSSNVFATDTSIFSAPAVVDPSCANYSGSDVWFRFIVPANGNITVETAQEPGSALTDTGMSLYASDGVEIDCDDDDGDGTFSQISLENRTPGEFLFARVWAFNGVQNGDFKISAYSEEVLGINETSATSQIDVYPNPTKNVVTIKSIEAISSVQIFNLLGQKILDIEGTALEMQANLSNQPSGVYLANITTEDGKQSIKIIKE